MPRDRFSNPALGHNVCMEKKQTPEQDDQQLYGHEMRLIGTHGVEHPGPDQVSFRPRLTSRWRGTRRPNANQRTSDANRRIGGAFDRRAPTTTGERDRRDVMASGDAA